MRVPGWLEQDDVRLIPDELRPEFNVAVDARGANEEEWDDWRLMYYRAARLYDFSSISGYNGISRCCCQIGYTGAVLALARWGEEAMGHNMQLN